MKFPKLVLSDHRSPVTDVFNLKEASWGLYHKRISVYIVDGLVVRIEFGSAINVPSEKYLAQTDRFTSPIFFLEEMIHCDSE